MFVQNESQFVFVMIVLFRTLVSLNRRGLFRPFSTAYNNTAITVIFFPRTRSTAAPPIIEAQRHLRIGS
jgi:hypothetical protein